MAMTPQEAVKVISTQGRLFEAAMVIANNVRDLEGDIARGAELKNAIATEQGNLAKVRGEIDKANGEYKKARDKVRAAEVEAGQVVADAKKQAADIIAKAKDDAVKAAAAIADRERGKLDPINASISEAQAELDRVNADIANGKKKLTAQASEVTELERRAGEARAYLDKLKGV